MKINKSNVVNPKEIQAGDVVVDTDGAVYMYMDNGNYVDLEDGSEICFQDIGVVRPVHAEVTISEFE